MGNITNIKQKENRLALFYTPNAVLQEGISQGAAHQRAAGADGLRRADRLEAGVDLDQVHGYQVARLVHAFADEVALAQGQSATHRGTGAGRPLGIQCINVKRQMDRRVVADVCQSHLDDPANTVPVS